METFGKICAICSSPFSVGISRIDTAVTCSLPCRGKWLAKKNVEKRSEVICKGCGNAFYVPKCHKARRVYCSKECAEPSRKLGPKAESHYMWRGGKASHSDGYLYISAKEHPFGGKSGYIFEHRAVMETWMREDAPDHRFLIEIDGGKYLSPAVHVHHINHVRKDNRRDNLLACTTQAHLSIHRGAPPMDGEVWPEVVGSLPFEPYRVERICETCGKLFMIGRSEVKRGNGKFCTRSCYDLRNRDSFPIVLKSEN